MRAAVALWTALALGACAPTAGAPAASGAATRIGCLDATCDEVLADLELAPHASSIGPRGQPQPFLHPAGGPAVIIDDAYGAEAWAAAGVDALVVPRLANVPFDTLRRVAPVHVVHAPRQHSPVEGGLRAFRDNLWTLAEATGRHAQARAAEARFDAVLAGLRARSTAESRAWRVMVFIDTTGYWPLPRHGAFCEALAAAGVGVCQGHADAIRELSAAALLALDPDRIVYLGVGGPLVERTDPTWRRLRAVREGHVYLSPAARHYWCCSLRALVPALQEYAHHFLDPTVPAPGPVRAFDPRRSALIAR